MAELKITTPFITSAADYHEFDAMLQTLRQAMHIATDKPGQTRNANDVLPIAYEELHSLDRDYYAVFYVPDVDDISGILEEWNSRA